MPPPTESTKNSSPSTASTGRESTVEGFRSFLRQADKLIKEGFFDRAKEQLALAKKIDPANPFIIAFEERIRIFENKKTKEGDKKEAQAQKAAGEDVVAVADEEEEHQQVAREQLEQKLHDKIDSEYKIKFTQELRKAEEHTAKIIEEERSKLELQRQVLKSKYDQQLSEAQHRLEEEYRKRMEEELSRADQRLQGQFQSKLALVEQETKAQLVLSYEEKQLELQQRLKREQEEMLEQERRSFEEREKKTKEQFDRQLLEALRKTETVIREQSVQQQQLEKEQLRQQLTIEMQESLHSEREAIKVQYDAMKANIEQAFLTDQQKLKEEHQRYLEEQLAVMKKREAEEFEQQRVALRQELENEYREKLKKQLAAEREKLQQEAEATIEQEKKRLHDEHKELVDLQDDKVRKIRVDLQKEMELNFLKRMEQIANEYDSKMELLGTKIPESTEEKHKLYREKMRLWYVNGQPTVDDARKIMDDAEQKSFMVSDAFDPLRTVVIETDPVFPADTTVVKNWKANITSYNLNSITIDVSTPANGYLSLSEVYYPGWNAYIDGVIHPILRANWNLRAVPIEQGNHKVELRFEPKSFTHGMWITFVTLGITIVGLGFSFKKSPHVKLTGGAV